MTLEQILSHIVYLFNTIDTHFLLIGFLILVLAIERKKRSKEDKNYKIEPIYIITYTILFYILYKYADFSPYFLFFTPLILLLLALTKNFKLKDFIYILVTYIIIFYIQQFILISIPFTIILKDWIIPLWVIQSSFFTVEPTTLSIAIPLVYTVVFTSCLYFKPKPLKDKYATMLIIILIVGSITSHIFIPVTPTSIEFKPTINKEISDTVIYLNIDGLRLDKFEKASPEFINKIEKNGVYFKNGATSVYRALTEPAFSSVLMGIPPEIHKINNNNFDGKFPYESLIDIMPTKLYGNIHMKDLANDNSLIIPLTTYKTESDRILIETLKKEIIKKKEKLYIADFSLVDLSGHAYGSNNEKYIEAIKQTIQEIEEFIDWLNENKIKATIIITSDHGQSGSDHGYFISTDRYVPLIFLGEGIKKGETITYQPSIIDLNPTISYITGTRYTEKSTGKVLLEVLEN